MKDGAERREGRKEGRKGGRKEGRNKGWKEGRKHLLITESFLLQQQEEDHLQLVQPDTGTHGIMKE